MPDITNIEPLHNADFYEDPDKVIGAINDCAAAIKYLGEEINRKRPLQMQDDGTIKPFRTISEQDLLKEIEIAYYRWDKECLQELHQKYFAGGKDA